MADNAKILLLLLSFGASACVQTPSNANYGATKGKYWCFPEGWADANISMELAKPDVVFVGVGTIVGSEIPGAKIKRLPLAGPDDIARLSLTTWENGKAYPTIYTLARDRSGYTLLWTDPADFLDETGAPAPRVCSSKEAE